jgi:hypothetical protein
VRAVTYDRGSLEEAVNPTELGIACPEAAGSDYILFQICMGLRAISELDSL